MADRRIWEDPKMARTLSRFVWVVLVVGLLVLTESHPPDGWRWVGPVVIVTACAALMFPTMLGLYKNQQHSRTKPYRVILFALLAKILATGWVAWLVH